MVEPQKRGAGLFATPPSFNKHNVSFTQNDNIAQGTGVAG
jgi:hypothetical protein